MEARVDVMMPFLVGFLCIGVGVFFWWSDKRLEKLCTSQVVGVVVDEGHSIQYRNGKRKEGYRPTVAYSVEGVEYTKKANTGHSVQRVSTGQSVTVFYDPSKPQRYYILEARGVEPLIVWLPVALGVVFILVGFLLHTAD